jgi:hypothetical protein
VYIQTHFLVYSKFLYTQGPCLCTGHGSSELLGVLSHHYVRFRQRPFMIHRCSIPLHRRTILTPYIGRTPLSSGSNILVISPPIWLKSLHIHSIIAICTKDGTRVNFDKMCAFRGCNFQPPYLDNNPSKYHDFICARIVSFDSIAPRYFC